MRKTRKINFYFYLLILVSFKGKSRFLCGLLSEYKSHFELDGNEELRNIFYFHLADCENTYRLKHEFEKDENKNVKLRFSKKIPSNLSEIIPPKSLIICDDLESVFLNDKKLIQQLHIFSSVLCHHKQIFFLFVAQSVSILKKSSKIQSSIANATHFIIFRYIMESKALKRFLSSLGLKMKSGLSISEIYEKYILPKRYSYFLICISSRALRATAYSNILHESDGNMISYHDSEDEEDI